MGTAIEQLGIQTAGQAVGAGMGLILGNLNDKRQLRQQEKLQELQIKGQKEMMDHSYTRQMNMWHDTNYSAQVDEMIKAGLNPGLMYGMSGGGGTTTGNANANVSGGQAPSGGGEAAAFAGMGMMNAANLKLMQAQEKVLESQANLNNVEAVKKGGVETENIKADTANKILDQVIKDFTGKELKSQFENVSEPNRPLSQIANADQLAAASDIASVVQRLMKEGKLYEKNIAEIEALVLQNSKTREETKNIQKQFDILEENLKGAKLENIMKELETRLQQQTGIDKNSPAWMKIIGRLFVQLMGKQ